MRVEEIHTDPEYLEWIEQRIEDSVCSLFEAWDASEPIEEHETVWREACRTTAVDPTRTER